MLDPDRALQAAIFDRLRADAALGAMIGEPARVYDQPPPDPVYPFVTLGRATTTPFGGLDGDGLQHVVTLTVISRFGGAEEAKAVLAAVRASLDDADLVLTDHRLIDIRATFGDVFRASDWRSIYGVLRLRAVTEPLI